MAQVVDESGIVKTLYSEESSLISNLGWSTDGSRLALVTGNVKGGEIEDLVLLVFNDCYQVIKNQVIAHKEAPGNLEVKWSPNGKYLVVLKGLNVCLFKMDFGEIVTIHKADYRDSVEGSLQWSSDGTLLAFIWGPDIYIYDISKNEEMKINVPGAGKKCVWIPDSHRLLVIVSEEDLGIKEIINRVSHSGGQDARYAYMPIVVNAGSRELTELEDMRILSHDQEVRVEDFPRIGEAFARWSR